MTLSIELKRFEKRIEKLAKKTHQSPDTFVHQALYLVEEFLEDQEDYYAALEVWKRVEQGKEKLYTRAELKKVLANSKRKSA